VPTETKRAKQPAEATAPGMVVPAPSASGSGLREGSGLALQEVADQTGVSSRSSPLVEKGQSDLSVNRFMRICELTASNHRLSSAQAGSQTARRRTTCPRQRAARSSR
jgi:transcriptional regulator with XRE-family HTH domain